MSITDVHRSNRQMHSEPRLIGGRWRQPVLVGTEQMSQSSPNGDKMANESKSSADSSPILPPLSERNYWPPESAQLRTKLPRERLVANAKVMGFDHEDNAALMCVAMILDPNFREQLIRLNFEKAMREVRK